MTLKRKVWLWLVLVATLILVIDLSVSYRKLRSEIRAETEYDARTIYGFMMATRRIYQEQFLSSGLPVTDRTVGFLPAHSFSRIAKDFANWNDNGILFNNVSDRPRNPANQADGNELKAIDWFRAHPKAIERLDDIQHPDGKKYLLYSAPIWIEPFCLKCHGTREAAPPSIRDGYDTAYGYVIGDLRGLVSIKIPTEKFEQRFREVWVGQFGKSLAGYTLLLLVIGFLIDRLITARLNHLKAGAEKIAAGDYAARLTPSSNDEICQVAHAFNRMAEEVQTREQMLTKLSLAIEQSPESIIITDLNGKIEYVNGCFTRNTGYSREEVLGKNPRFLQSGKTSREHYAALWASLKAGHGWSGEFTNRRKDGTEYIESVSISPVRTADGTITHYLAVKQDITEKKRTEAQMHHLAYYDSLTNLANRRLLGDRLGLSMAVAQRQGHIDALLLLNLDRFKNLNDAYGHDIGDLLLIAVGGRLAGLLREGDTLARLASDEFAILLQDLGHVRDTASQRAMAVAEKVHTSLQLPFRVDDQDITITTCLGITLCPEDERDSPQDALRRADTALHRAKDAGGNQTAFFEDDMAVAARHRYTIERELRRAIPQGELRLYLQPQVNPAGQVVGAEALVRWQHPERGLLPPAAFIAIAEESDLIVDLGAWVLSEACQLLAREAINGHLLRLSVNLSPRQFAQPGFLIWVRDLLTATGADPTLLTLEITEGLAIGDIDAVIGRMNALTTLGLQFSVDDFGTGYSSLSYIKRLPIHELKIDKSFVQDAPSDPNDAALVETILSVAHHMKLQVVAEGVETPEQAEFLAGHTHTAQTLIYQGYLYGKPAPAEDWIARWR